MLKKSFLFTAVAVVLVGLPTYAASSEQVYDPSLKQATSCSEVEAVMKEYLGTYRNAGRFGPVAEAGVMLNDAATKSAIQAAGGIGGGGGGSDFSATNVQKEGVDEPELVKNDGTYIYYLDQQQGVIHILDISSRKEVGKILLPKEYWNTQLLLNGKKLILVGTKSLPFYGYDKAFINRDQQAMVAIYDISNISAPKMIQSYLYDGYLQDSRVVNNKLVLVASQYFNRGPVYRAVDDMISKNTKKSLTIQDFSIKAADVLPKRTVVSYKQITAAGKPKLIARKNSLPVSCSQLLYKKPDPQKKGSYYGGGESLTSIVTLPLDTSTPTPTIKTIVGNSSQIHVSKKSVYLTSPVYVPYTFACPVGAAISCPMWRGEGSYTAIYGFALDNLSYTYSSLVGGNTYNQYSMDEDGNGIFRIVTSNWKDGKTNSNVYTLGGDGKIVGKLEGIAPNENFYGVRFMGDELYLVTYRQIDPLFVISLADVKQPRIIGQLKMPGYSTYLHPYGPKENGVQYMIGLGYDTRTNENGGEQQGGVKLDLYKADFNTADTKGNITVKQVWSKVYGEANSQTEALYNPRMFVYNTAQKELILPIVIAKTTKGQQCNVIYDTAGKEVSKQCYPTEQPTTTFAGIKAWSLSPQALTEKFSINYMSMVKNPYEYSQDITVNPRLFSSLQARVGYNGSQYYFVGNQFAHFFTAQDQSGAYIQFSGNIAPQTVGVK